MPPWNHSLGENSGCTTRQSVPSRLGRVLSLLFCIGIAQQASLTPPALNPPSHASHSHCASCLGQRPVREYMLGRTPPGIRTPAPSQPPTVIVKLATLLSTSLMLSPQQRHSTLEEPITYPPIAICQPLMSTSARPPLPLNALYFNLSNTRFQACCSATSSTLSTKSPAPRHTTLTLSCTTMRRPCPVDCVYKFSLANATGRQRRAPVASENPF